MANTVQAITVPYDGGSTGEGGSRNGAAVVVDANIEHVNVKVRYDDIELADVAGLSAMDVSTMVRKRVDKACKRQRFPLVVGGDDSITYGFLDGMAGWYDDLCVLHFDAHPDVEEGPLHHGSWLRFAIEDGLVHTVVSVGVRDLPYLKAEKKVGRKLGIHYVDHISQAMQYVRYMNYVLCIDVDVLDPTQMPATGVPMVNGMSVNSLIEQVLVTTPVAASITEFAPHLDVGQVGHNHVWHLYAAVLTLFE